MERGKSVEISGGKGKMRKIKIMTRFKLCNEWRASKYWTDEEKRKCRMCGREEETGEHVLKASDYTAQEQEADMIMNGEGDGIEWMKIVLKERSKV